MLWIVQSGFKAIGHNRATIGNQIAISIFTVEQVRWREHQGTTLDNAQSSRQNQLIRELMTFVQNAVAVGVFEHHHKAIRFEFVGAFKVLHKAAHFHNPQSAVFIPLHGDGIAHEWFGGNQFHAESARDLEAC